MQVALLTVYSHDACTLKDVAGGYGTEANPQGLIFARRYDASGAPQGDEFRASLSTSAVQFSPSVAMDSDGAFVVASHDERFLGEIGIQRRLRLSRESRLTDHIGASARA